MQIRKQALTKPQYGKRNGTKLLISTCWCLSRTLTIYQLSITGYYVTNIRVKQRHYKTLMSYILLFQNVAFTLRFFWRSTDYCYNRRKRHQFDRKCMITSQLIKGDRPLFPWLKVCSINAFYLWIDPNYHSFSGSQHQRCTGSMSMTCVSIAGAT